jgi:hypothetical protein
MIDFMEIIFEIFLSKHEEQIVIDIHAIRKLE